MGFIESVRVVLTQKYATFGGRARRSEYWWFILFATLVAIVIGVPAALFFIIGGETYNNTLIYIGGGFMLVYAIFALAILVPAIAVTVRRFRDRNISGWWVLALYILSVIPYVGIAASIVLIVIAVLPGTEGENRFGPDPKQSVSHA